MQTWNRYYWIGVFLAIFAWTGCKKSGGDARKKKVQALIKQLKSDETDKREAAAQALEKLGPYAKDAIPALIEAIRDEDDKVKYAAIRALGKTKMASPAPVIGALTRALKHSDAQVRIEAAHAISYMGMPAIAAKANLLTMMRDPSETDEVKAAVKKALQRIR